MNMSNNRLGEIAIQEIRESMRGLTGKPAKQQAVRMAELHGVGWQRIYSLTEDLRPKRKPRADKGKRTYEIVEGTDVWKAAELVINDKLDPDQALLTCKVRGVTNLPTLETFRRMLAEKGLGKKQRRASKRAFRSWEAAFPGEMFQIDVTALKVRWQDEKTRRILRIDGVDKNHPQMDESKLRVWQIMLVDDHSRRRFLRYVTTTHITSREMVRFECEAFSELGIPHKLYTDNGSEFKGHHTKAQKILNSLLKDDGGYQHLTHAPGNSQASGKVENAHKWAEKMDRYVGLAVTEGQIVEIEDLNRFAVEVCEDYNNRKHRVTGETPMARWHSTRVLVRKLDPAIIESALLSEEVTRVLDASMTIAVNNAVYLIPSFDPKTKTPSPFVNFIGQPVKVTVPPNIDVIYLRLPDGSEYEVIKVLATAEKAGKFRSTADSNAETLKKRLKETRKESIKAAKTKQKQTGEIVPVPHYNVKIEQPATNISRFPQAERVVSAEEINKIVPVAIPAYQGRDIGYWEAVAEFSRHFAGVDETKEFMLGLFQGMEGTQPAAEIEEAIERRNDQQERTPLRAVS